MKDNLKSIRSEQKEALQKQADPADEFMQEAAEGWSKAGTENFDRVLNRLDERIDQASVPAYATPAEPKVRKLFSPWSAGIAASIVLLAAGFWWFTRPAAEVSSGFSTDDLYAEYYKPLSTIGIEPTFRGEHNHAKSKEKAAATAYDARDYDIAIVHYRELLKEKPGDPKYTLMMGIALMSYEQYDDAITLFNAYVPAGVTYDEDIEWYLALAHLKKGQFNSARSLFEKLAARNGSYYKINALEILARFPRKQE